MSQAELESGVRVHPRVLDEDPFAREPDSMAMFRMTRPAISDSGRKAIVYVESDYGGYVLYLFRGESGWSVAHSMEAWHRF